MKHIGKLLVVLMASLSSYAQDIDLHIVRPDDKFATLTIPKEMTLDEFQILSRHLRMKDMMYAMVVPGYVHFRANEPTTGYVLLGMRSAAYASLFAITLDSALDFKRLVQFDYDLDTETEVRRIKLYTGVAVVSMMTIFGTYFYDWIHGQYKLDSKQEQIRFKYSLKVDLNQSPLPQGQSQVIPELGFRMRF